MASMQIEVASSSSPFNYSRRDHNHSTNITGYMTQCIRKNKAHDEDKDSSWLPSKNSNTDDSWLPAHVTSKSYASHHPKGHTDVDDSWLPTNNDTKGKGRTNTSTEKDIDYSWLPSTFIDKKEKKQKNDNVKEKKKNKTDSKIKNNEKNNISKINKKSNVNTNNTNTDSETQKKSKNNHWALAREVVFSSDQHVQNDDQQHDSSKSKYTVESPSSVGVSTLLRRWSALGEEKNSNENDNLSPACNRSNVGSTCKESKSSTQSPPSTMKDSDWESDNTSRSRWLSCPLPSRDIKDSHASAAKKEKIRVGDIIKKLSKEEEMAASQAGGNGNESLPRIRTSLDNQQIEELKGFKDVKVSRIRGRQAFDNFLMLTENNKDRELKWLLERKTVSKFSQRGRLKAMLRFKSLRLDAEPKPKLEAKRHRRSVSKTLDSNNRVAIMDLRERFDSGSEKGETKSRKHRKSVLMNIQNEEQYSTPTAGKEVYVTPKTKAKTTSFNISNKKQEPCPKPEPMTPNLSTPHTTNSCKYMVQKADANSSSNSMRKTRYKDDNKYDFQEDEGQFMSAKTSYTSIEDRGNSDSEETIYTAKKTENFEDWMTSEYSQTRSELDENESYDMQLFETNYDWISDISRPKSEWEDMRKARYQEMLERSSGKADIQRLLERKTVSNFLSSSLRDLIDHVMMNRIQQSHVQVGKKVMVTAKGMSRKEEVEQEYGSVVDEDGDYRSRTRQFSEYSEYVDRTPYSERLWRPNDGAYSSETTTTTTTTSPSLERSLSSNRSQNNSTPQSSPAVIHPSVEMELIYDLRGHMEQLHQEIMELRRSIKGCVNMQVKMQLSFKQNVAVAAATHSVQKKERKPLGIGKTCSICGDMQVDSLLYRCGHMCTCFGCAVELQRISGECPVCEAPIVDVVMAFVHEN
ncbi:hypothetical protein Lser_V15G06573 [Lactuca serriola]